MNSHLSEAQFQQYADAPKQISVKDQLHLDSCSACQAQLAEYRLISAALKEMPVPAFDFDLNELVPQTDLQARKASLPWIAIAAAVAGIAIVGISLVGYSGNIIWLTKTIPTAQLYLLSLPAAALCITQLIILVVRYQRAMHEAIQQKTIFLQPGRNLTV
ncbi:hypothetical protein [Pedobacter sp. JY14-1]|uniref:anti-sigma factor family protein n=1 Tax=Pedobacter sp. JY14-1 TaxID=3034151 RepID=UPI0023E32C13|nr:hypothetical protein [Pedobacter sp. JY14-1]